MYNQTVGGTYDVMRKVSAEEIKDNIIRYGLPEDATDDVKEVAKQMGKKEVVASYALQYACYPHFHLLLFFDSNPRKPCFSIR